MTRKLDFIVVSEVEDGAVFARPVFDRRFRLTAPDFPNHVVAFYCRDDGAFDVACYIHFTDCGDILLCGGAVTDNRVLKRMSEAQRDALRDVGGVAQHALVWSLNRYKDRFAAVFAYCGDTAARRVCDIVGFEATAHQYLIGYWLKPLAASQREQLIAKANGFGAF